ncbi:MAG TPA: hypothetical protein VF292_03905 [Rhodanobacteraceae bacterium]
MLFTTDTFRALSRDAFEAYTRFRFPFRGLQVDGNGQYLSGRTRKAWDRWLCAHPDARVVDGLWAAAGQPSGARTATELTYQGAVLRHVNRLAAQDTVAAVWQRIADAAACGGELLRMRGLFRDAPESACVVQRFLLDERR